MKRLSFLLKVTGPILLVGSYVHDTVHIIKVNGISMSPNINHGDILFGYTTNSYSVGDVLLISSPLDGNLQVKRLISKSRVVMDPNSKFATNAITGIILQDGKLWVEGDYNSHSIDSNNYGPLPSSSVVAKIYYKWPFAPIQSMLPERYKYRLNQFNGLFVKYPWYHYSNIMAHTRSNQSIPVQNRSPTF